MEKQLIEGINRRAKGLAEAHRAPSPVVTIGESTPPTVNTPGLVSRVVPILAKELGTSNVVEVEPVMGAEDFGLFGQGGVPTFMFRLGTIPGDRVASANAKGRRCRPTPLGLLLSDAPTGLRVGVEAMTSAVVGLLPPGSEKAER